MDNLSSLAAERNTSETGAQPYRKQIVCTDEVSAEATPVLWKQKKPTWSFLIWQSAETLYDNIATNRWICFKQSAPAIRFGEQTCIAYSRWGRINAL